MEAQASGGLAAGPTDADRSAAGAQAPPPSQQHPGAADSAPDASAAASSKTKKKKKHGSKAPTASSDAGAKPAAAATVSISRLLAGDMDAVGRHPGLLHPEVVILTLAATVNGALFLASAAHQQHKQGPENQVASTAGRTLWAHVVSALYYTLNVSGAMLDSAMSHAHCNTRYSPLHTEPSEDAETHKNNVILTAYNLVEGYTLNMCLCA
jgi:hypothetical protein